MLRGGQVITSASLHGILDMETLMVKTLGAAVAGLASHWLYFVRGEHHLHAPLLFYGYILVAISIYVYERSQAGGQLDSGYLPSGFASASAIIAAYAVSLFSSIITYRLFFHRLRGFPGPLSLRVSKLWHVYKTLDSKNHLYLEGLREQYGSFVRTGEFDLCIGSAFVDRLPMMKDLPKLLFLTQTLFLPSTHMEQNAQNQAGTT